MQDYIAKLHTWGAQNWWHALIVNGAGVVLGLLLIVFGAKYLPASVQTEIEQGIAQSHVDALTVSGTTVQLP